jgi:hypothetical protein
MRYLCRTFLIIFLIGLSKAGAQSNVFNSGFPSGDYDEVKVSCDIVLKTFTIIDNSEQGAFSCSLFLSGSLIKNKDGKYPVKAYPYGFNNKAFDGTVMFREGKNGHKGSLIIQVSEAGSCQNMTDYKAGVYFPLDKIVAYKRFGMVKVPKAVAYIDSLLISNKKGYLVERDFISVLKETKDFCYITYLKKPSFKAWVKRSDLIL